MSEPRYFERFYSADPMLELTEAEARALGTYVVEEGGPLRRYRRVIDGELNSFIYAGWDDPSEPLADLVRSAAGVRAEIHSPVESTPEGGKRWRMWHVDAAGAVKKLLEREHDREGRVVREDLRSAAGDPIDHTIYRRSEDGTLLELVTYAPDGSVRHRQKP